MINNLKESSITKKELLEGIKKKIKKEKEQVLRNILSKDSFELASWDKYLAHQLGFMSALEELDRFVPDPENIK